MRRLLISLTLVLAACSSASGDTAEGDIEILETMFGAFWTGDADTALPILGRVGADHVASETRYQSLIEASVTTECEGLGDGITQCDITYSNMFYDAVGAEPDVTRKTFTVSNGVVTLLDSRFPADTDVTDSVRDYIIRNDLDADNVCATREVYHVNGEACADLVISHISGWVEWHTASEQTPDPSVGATVTSSTSIASSGKRQYPDAWVAYEANLVGSDDTFWGGHVMIVGSDGIGRDLVDAEDGVVRSCPRFSPNGSMVSYGEASDQEGTAGKQNSIVIADFDRGTGTLRDPYRIDVELSPLSEGAPVCAQWSADGSQLAFLTNTGRLTVVSVANSNLPVVIGDSFSSFEWAPTGDQIATVRAGDVWIYTVGEAERLNLVSLSDVGQMGARSISWSPDGQRLAVEIETYDDNQPSTTIWTVDLDGFVLAEWPSHHLPLPGSFGPLWSPDGDWIAYGQHDPDVHTSSIILVPTGAGPPVEVNTDVDFYWAGMQWVEDDWIVVLDDGEAEPNGSVVMIPSDPDLDPVVLWERLGEYPTGRPSITHANS